jgi:hypothetical protein
VALAVEVTPEDVVPGADGGHPHEMQTTSPKMGATFNGMSRSTVASGEYAQRCTGVIDNICTTPNGKRVATMSELADPNLRRKAEQDNRSTPNGKRVATMSDLYDPNLRRKAEQDNRNYALNEPTPGDLAVPARPLFLSAASGTAR